MGNKLCIADEYRTFVISASRLTLQEVKEYPLEKRETLRDRQTEHIIDMLHMYSARYASESFITQLQAILSNTPDHSLRMELNNFILRFSGEGISTKPPPDNSG